MRLNDARGTRGLPALQGLLAHDVNTVRLGVHPQQHRVDHLRSRVLHLYCIKKRVGLIDLKEHAWIREEGVFQSFTAGEIVAHLGGKALEGCERHVHAARVLLARPRRGEGEKVQVRARVELVLVLTTREVAEKRERPREGQCSVRVRRGPERVAHQFRYKPRNVE